MSEKIDTKRPLSRRFKAMAKGNPHTLAMLKEIAATARAIDPDCPYGPHGVLDSLEKYGLTPQELLKLYAFCNKNPLALNAVDYGVFKNIVTVGKIRKALKAGNPDLLNIPRIVEQAKRMHKRLGTNLNRRPR